MHSLFSGKDRDLKIQRQRVLYRGLTGKAGHIKFSNEDWDNIVNNVNVAFDNFTLKLKETYPELTDLDIRFCCLLKMNLTINDLVAIYCLDRKSIYKKKERIKKDRMHLNDSRSLNEILNSFSTK